MGSPESRLNIRRFETPATMESPSLNAENYLSPAEWQQAFELIREYREKGKTYSLVNLAAAMKVLNPDDTSFTKEDAEHIRSKVEKQDRRVSDGWLDILCEAASMRILGEDIEFDEEQWKRMRGVIQATPGFFYSGISWLRILNRLPPAPPENIVQGLQQQMDGNREANHSLIKDFYVAKIIGAPLTPTADDWSRIHSELSRLREEAQMEPNTKSDFNPTYFLFDNLMAIKVIQEPNLIIDENGVSFSKKKSEETHVRSYPSELTIP